MEGLTTHFARNFFDLVHCTNALDHAQDPIKAVEQMIAIVRPGHIVQIVTWVNESSFMGGDGMHQWDLFADSRGRFMISDRRSSRDGAVTDLTNAFARQAEVEVLLKAEYWHTAAITPESCAARWRRDGCVMEVRLKKLTHAHSHS